MDRESILEKYRNEKNDEGMENSENTGRVYGMTAFYWVILILFIVSLYLGKRTELIWIFMLISFAIENFTKYRFARAPKYLRRASFWGIWAMLCIVIYVGRMMGW